ncbi:hypothetical protein H4Q26_007720 [Puccinia striiformis f. sp. tritici PST-130]|nr:hypothetical protein H4Q26_007720 [Puccinia striiformis f. sp. tritici PST-130]
MLKIHNNNNSIKNSAETSTPPGKAPKPPKSISPEKLKKSKSPTHDLENVDLSMMSKPFLPKHNRPAVTIWLDAS